MPLKQKVNIQVLLYFMGNAPTHTHTHTHTHTNNNNNKAKKTCSKSNSAPSSTKYPSAINFSNYNIPQKFKRGATLCNGYNPLISHTYTPIT
jgi:hypothetical protein